MVPPARELTSTAGDVAASGSRHPRWAVAAWIVVATGIQLARQTGAPAWDTIWAEDSYLFLDDALNDGPLSVLRPIGGYLYVGPRLIGLVLAALPLEWAAAGFALSAAVIVSCLSVYVFRASSELLPSPAYRAVLAAAMVLLPAAGMESLNNLANIQFFLFFAACWALPPFRRLAPATAADHVVVVAAALSGGIAPLLVPGAVWSLRRGSPRRSVGAVFLAALAVHAAIVVGTSLLGLEAEGPWAYPEPLIGVYRFVLILPVYGALVAAPTFLGNQALLPVWDVLGWGTSLLAVSFVGALFLLARRTGRHRLFAAATALAFSVANFGLAFLLRPVWLHAFPPNETFTGDRYTMIAGWLLLTCCAILIHDLRRSRFATILRGTALVVLILVALGDLRVSNLRSKGPRWSASLALAAQLCEGRPESARISVRTPPLATVYSGAVEVPCSRL